MTKPITESTQIIKVCRVLEEGGEKLNAVVSNPYGNIPAWRSAFIAMARRVSSMFYPEQSSDEQDLTANVLLRQAAMAMKIDPVGRRVTEPDKMHPGEAQISDDVLENDNAVQALSVWVIPAEDCDEDCPAHAARTQISGDTSVIETKDMGMLLSQIAFQHAFFESKGSEAERLKIIAQIQKDFMVRFDLGQTKH